MGVAISRFPQTAEGSRSVGSTVTFTNAAPYDLELQHAMMIDELRITCTATQTYLVAPSATQVDVRKFITDVLLVASADRVVSGNLHSIYDMAKVYESASVTYLQVTGLVATCQFTFELHMAIEEGSDAEMTIIDGWSEGGLHLTMQACTDANSGFVGGTPTATNNLSISAQVEATTYDDLRGYPDVAVARMYHSTRVASGTGAGVSAISIALPPNRAIRAIGLHTFQAGLPSDAVISNIRLTGVDGKIVRATNWAQLRAKLASGRGYNITGYSMIDNGNYTEQFFVTGSSVIMLECDVVTSLAWNSIITFWSVGAKG